MGRFAARIADLQFICLHERRRWEAIPVAHGLVMFSGLVFTPVLEPDHGIASEGHQVGKEKSIGRFDFVLFILRFRLVARAGGMPCKWERHILTTSIIPAAAPFFC